MLLAAANMRRIRTGLGKGMRMAFGMAWWVLLGWPAGMLFGEGAFWEGDSHQYPRHAVGRAEAPLSSGEGD